VSRLGFTRRLAVGAVLVAVSVSVAAPATAVPATAPDERITSINGQPYSTDRTQPSVFSLPLTIRGTTTMKPPARPEVGQTPWSWFLGIGSPSVRSKAYSGLLFCGNTPWTDPALGWGVYGAPPVAADGTWECQIALDPNWETDDLGNVDPDGTVRGWGFVDPATLVSSKVWNVAEAWGNSTCVSSPTFCSSATPTPNPFFTVADVQDVPVAAPLTAGVVLGLGVGVSVLFMILRCRRRASV